MSLFTRFARWKARKMFYFMRGDGLRKTLPRKVITRHRGRETRGPLSGKMNEIRLDASIIIMKMKTRDGHSLAKGQVWKTRAAEVEIVALGKRFIHYRISPQVQPKLVSAQISGIEAMANYLKANAARLVKGDSTN